MKRLLCGLGAAFLLGGFVCAAAAAPVTNAPAGAKMVDADKLPRCFVDKNSDNVCDKSVLAGGACKAKHVKRVPPAKADEKPAAEAAEEKQKPATTSRKTGCTGCGRCLFGKGCAA